MAPMARPEAPGRREPTRSSGSRCLGGILYADDCRRARRTRDDRPVIETGAIRGDVMAPVQNTTMWGLIEAAARDRPGQVLFRDDYGRSLTAEQYRDAAERVAAGLG